MGLQTERKQTASEPEKALRQIGDLMEQLFRRQDAVQMEPLADWLMLQLYRGYALRTEEDAAFRIDRADVLELAEKELARLERNGTRVPEEQAAVPNGKASVQAVINYAEGRLKETMKQGQNDKA